MPEPVQTAVVMGTATLPNCQSSTRKYMAPKLKRTGRLVFKGQNSRSAARCSPDKRTVPPNVWTCATGLVPEDGMATAINTSTGPQHNIGKGL